MYHTGPNPNPNPVPYEPALISEPRTCSPRCGSTAVTQSVGTLSRRLRPRCAPNEGRALGCTTMGCRISPESTITL